MATKRVPNYGPGSISTVAKGRLENLKAQEGKKPMSLLNALSPAASQIKNRVEAEQKLKKEYGGRR